MEIKESAKGIGYLHRILKDKVTTITRASFWRIPHANRAEEISLKIGRYNKVKIDGISEFIEVPENETPKSYLTLDDEELHALIEFISENYEPLRSGVKKFIPIDEEFDPAKLEHLKAFFDNPDSKNLAEFIAIHNLIPEDLEMSLIQRDRNAEISIFEEMLDMNLPENVWQKWFKKNKWILGTDVVSILEERDIDTENIADYLIEAYDGFLDIIELKKPDPDLNFWSPTLDHENYIPSSDLTKAVIQTMKYIHEVEREADSIKFGQRVDNIGVIKPRGLLIFGRSNTWNKQQKEAYRILNCSFHNISILTYDHILGKAKQLLKASPIDHTQNIAKTDDTFHTPF